MTTRATLVPLFATCLLVLPAAASEPVGSAGKMIANPPVMSEIDPGAGLPPVTCGGFQLQQPIDAVPPETDATFALRMAIVPFRIGGTNVVLTETAGYAILLLHFADGLVGGLTYDRSGWNDVTVHLRPATQDYVLTVNGVSAAPFPFSAECAQHGGCYSVGYFSLSSTAFDEDATGWIDTLSIVRLSAAGSVDLYVNNFSDCLLPRVWLGGLILTPPPPRLRTRR